MNTAESRNVLELPGLDGTNPLGFLASIGVLTTLHEAGEHGAQLAWKRRFQWIPTISGISFSASEQLCEILASALSGNPVSEQADHAREQAQKAFDAARKKIKVAAEKIKKRKIKGKLHREAMQAEVEPLKTVAAKKRAEWLTALKESVPSPELALGKHINCEEAEYREHAENFLGDASASSRLALDLLANFGSDANLEVRGTNKGRITPTPFCFITGAGHQYFLDTVRELTEHVGPRKLHEALFESWAYADLKFSMRWNPLDDRRYALMDRNPTASDNKSRTVWMANLLAYRALTMFPSAPRSYRLATTSWAKTSASVSLTWPIWEVPVGPDTLRSMLQLTELVKDRPRASRLAQMGICCAYRARKIRAGKYSNFSPARSVFVGAASRWPVDNWTQAPDAPTTVKTTPAPSSAAPATPTPTGGDFWDFKDDD